MPPPASVFEGKGSKYTNFFFRHTREGRDCRVASAAGCYETNNLDDTMKNPPGPSLSNVPKNCMFCPELSSMSGDQLLSGSGCNVREGGRCMSTEMCGPGLECVFEALKSGFGKIGTCSKRKTGFAYHNTSYALSPADLDLPNSYAKFAWSSVQYCDNALGNGYAPSLPPTTYPTEPGDEIEVFPPTPEPTSFADFYASETEETRQSLEIIFIAAALAMLVGTCMITILVQLTKKRDKLTLSQKNNKKALEELENNAQEKREEEDEGDGEPVKSRTIVRRIAGLYM